MLLRLTIVKRTPRQARTWNMPTTRSASRGTLPTVVPEAPALAATKPRSRKRKASETVDETEAKTPKKRANQAVKAKVDSSPSVVGFEIPPVGDAPALELLPAKLSFSYDEARTHLIQSDSRFAEVFTRQMCKPFEKLDRVEPFKYVCVAILVLLS